jgi:hypothetical protein
MCAELRMLDLKELGSTRRTEILNGANSAKRASERPRYCTLSAV